jgi:inosine-uridine nucleoside N-ribohydrolase
MLRWLAGLLLLPCLTAGERDLVLFDTDSGLFGDDGAALVMLLRSPAEVVVEGITVVPGNVWPAQGAEYMFHILDLLKRPMVPVMTGAQVPLAHTPAMAHEYERRWGAMEYQGAFADDAAIVRAAPGCKLTGRKPRHEAAIDFLISEIEHHPGAVTILALGPMTNVALALRMKPEIETKIKRIVFMGGNLHVPANATPLAEFNFWFDPEAARIVLRSRIQQKIMFSLDICNTAPIRKPQFDEVVAAHTPITDLFGEDLGNRYPAFYRHPDGVTFMWDALPAAYLLDPTIVTRSETQHLDVITAWGKFYGATQPLDRRVAPDATPVTVMLNLDQKRTWKLYKTLLTRHE